MKILITGATGFICSKLLEELLLHDYEVVILSRNKQKAEKKVSRKITVFEWKDIHSLPPKEAFFNINGLINLMGENIGGGRWSKEQKNILHDSRVVATNNLIKQLEATVMSPLDFFISSSAIGIYPVNSSQMLDETSPIGESFLANLCKEWEAAANTITKTKRKLIIRTGVVLHQDGGALAKMLPPFYLGLGGPIGDGAQFMSWIHRNDQVRVILEAITNEKYTGIVNSVSPNPISNLDFTKALGHALHRPTLFPVPKLILQAIFGEMSTLMIDSQKIIPTHLIDLGFQFKYATIDQAFAKIKE